MINTVYKLYDKYIYIYVSVYMYICECIYVLRTAISFFVVLGTIIIQYYICKSFFCIETIFF